MVDAETPSSDMQQAPQDEDDLAPMHVARRAPHENPTCDPRRRRDQHRDRDLINIDISNLRYTSPPFLATDVACNGKITFNIVLCSPAGMHTDYAGGTDIGANCNVLNINISDLIYSYVLVACHARGRHAPAGRSRPAPSRAAWTWRATSSSTFGWKKGGRPRAGGGMLWGCGRGGRVRCRRRTRMAGNHPGVRRMTDPRETMNRSWDRRLQGWLRSSRASCSLDTTVVRS